MGSGSRADVRRAALAVSAGIILTLAIGTGVATAHAGHPTSISATVNGMSVQVSGSWAWKGSANDPLPSYVGYAISWGDVTSGNDVGTYHIGDGTPATNVVEQPTSPDQGTSGTWGPAGHTYKAAGTYTVCSIIYDLGEVKPFPATGQESLVAGGPDRNPDNSVDNGSTPAVQCTTVVIAAAPTATPTETPTQSVEGATAVPTAVNTPPPTSTESPTSAGGSGLLVLVLGLWAALGAGAVKLYTLQRARR